MLVSDDLLLDHLLTEFELVDAVDEMLFGDIVAKSFHTSALDCFTSNFSILHDLF